jgi:dienelactone hydrolase
MRTDPRSARFLVTLALAVAIVAGCTVVTAHAQDQVADFKAGQPNGRYAFASSTPKTMSDLVRGNIQQDPVTIVGHLFLPPGSEKVPAVVLMHGSGGIYSAMLEFWPKQLNAAALAVFSVDSFGPRGVKSTAEDQSLVPFAADVADAFAALRLLATHPRIDARRIAIMGFSRGGMTAWRTAVERVIAGQKLSDDLRFAAHVPVYSGGCVGAFRLIVKPGVFGKAPMLWVHGDADDYTSIGPCQDYADRIGKAGTPVEFVTIAGARHKFDQDDPARTYQKGAVRIREDCPLEVDIDTGVYQDRQTGQRLQGDAVRDLMRKCSALGVTYEGSRRARDKAAEAIVAFLRKTLAA